MDRGCILDFIFIAIIAAICAMVVIKSDTPITILVTIGCVILLIVGFVGALLLIARKAGSGPGGDSNISSPDGQ